MNNTIPYNPKIPIIIDLIHTLYNLDSCGAGGLCHIVTDDDNIHDNDLQFVIDYCNRDENVNRVDKELSSWICQLLLQLTFEQRCVLFDLLLKDFDYKNYIDEDQWNLFLDISCKSIEELVEEYD